MRGPSAGRGAVRDVRENGDVTVRRSGCAGYSGGSCRLPQVRGRTVSPSEMTATGTGDSSQGTDFSVKSEKRKGSAVFEEVQKSLTGRRGSGVGRSGVDVRNARGLKPMRPVRGAAPLGVPGWWMPPAHLDAQPRTRISRSRHSLWAESGHSGSSRLG